MSDLEKAVTQKALTPDTVDAQFCSDWLKGQIKVLFFRLDETQKKLDAMGLVADDHAQARVKLREQLNETRSLLADIRAANARLAMHQVLQSAQLKQMQAALEKVEDERDHLHRTHET